MHEIGRGVVKNDTSATTFVHFSLGNTLFFPKFATKKEHKIMNKHVCPWFGKGEKRLAQIDMLIDRADKTVNICEMKFYNKPYAMTARDEEDIERKISTFIETTGGDKNVILTMITVKGIEKNEHSGCVQKEIRLEDLFVN